MATVRRPRCRWFEEKYLCGETHDATVQTNMNGHWRVITENLSVGGSTIMRFKGQDARRRAIEWASMVLIPAEVIASLAKKP